MILKWGKERGLNDLSPVELLIVKELLQSRKRAVIAERLGMSYESVESNIKTIYRKLKLKNRKAFMDLFFPTKQSKTLITKEHSLEVLSINEIRASFGKPPLKSGKTICLRCEKPFESEDVRLVRTCALCKSSNERIKD